MRFATIVVAVVIVAQSGGDSRLAQLSGRAGCVAPRGGSNSCATVAGLPPSISVALSPDGRTAYAAGGWDSLSAVVRLQRDRRTGALASGRGSCWVWSRRCAMPLNRPVRVVASPDSRFAYVAHHLSDVGVSMLARSADGGLTRVASVGATFPEGLAVSPDGRHVYVGTTRSSHAIIALVVDRARGTLERVEGTTGCVMRDNPRCTTSPVGRLEPIDLAVSPDGRHLYGASAWSTEPKDVIALARNATTGGLATIAAPTAEAVPGMASAIALSRDGRHVYVLSAVAQSGMLTVFARNSVTGALRPLQSVSHRRLGSGRLTVAPDGRAVYVAAGALTEFNRNNRTGRLTFRACFSQDSRCRRVRGLQGVTDVAVHGRFVYLAGDAVAVFRR